MPALALTGLLLWLSGCAAPVRVTWETETEINTAGFNLYRSTSPDGPFEEKVNAELIPPSADPLTGKEYTYLDTAARAGITYYYQLQEVERDGSINKFGPIRVRASSMQWQQFALLGGMALVVLYIWLRGGRILQNARSRHD